MHKKEKKVRENGNFEVKNQLKFGFLQVLEEVKSYEHSR